MIKVRLVSKNNSKEREKYYRQAWQKNPVKSRKPSKIGQGLKTLVSALIFEILIVIAKNSFLEGKLGTRSCLNPNLKFF